MDDSLANSLEVLGPLAEAIVAFREKSDELSQIERKIDGARSDLAKVKSQIADGAKVIFDGTQRLAAVKADINTWNQSLTDIQRQQGEALAKMKKTIAEETVKEQSKRDSTLASLDQTITERKAHIDELNKAILDLKSSHASLKADVEALRRKYA